MLALGTVTDVAGIAMKIVESCQSWTSTSRISNDIRGVRARTSRPIIGHIEACKTLGTDSILLAEGAVSNVTIIASSIVLGGQGWTDAITS